MISTVVDRLVFLRFACFKGGVRRNAIVTRSRRHEIAFLCPIVRALSTQQVGVVNQFIRRCSEKVVGVRAYRGGANLFSTTGRVR